MLRSGRKAARSGLIAGLCILSLLHGASGPLAWAQAPSASPAQAPPDAALPAATDSAPAPLDQEDLQILVARIALYPDELVALISAASLYPLEIVEAERFLEQRQKDPKRQPKSTWDPSVISLLNYPEIVKMMSEDLDWTQEFGTAIAYQQKDVLIAIQELRARAVASGAIKTDDKVTVTTENKNVVIQSANPEKVYIPKYAPEMLYEPGYAVAPVTYYDDSYPSYFWPTATFFTAAVTGAVWAATVDWNNWGVWGGPWRGNVDVDCNNCFNDRVFNGRVNINDIDWKNIDRDRIHIDRDQIGHFDRTNIRNGLELNRGNDLKVRASEIHRPARLPGGTGPVRDVRKSTLEGLKNGPAARPGGPGSHPGIGSGDHRPNVGAIAKPGGGAGVHRPNGGAVARPGGGARPAKPDRPLHAPKPGGRIDNRPRKPSGLGEVRSGRAAQIHSDRGARGRGGGMGGGHRAGERRGGGGGGGHAGGHFQGRRH